MDESVHENVSSADVVIVSTFFPNSSDFWVTSLLISLGGCGDRSEFDVLLFRTVLGRFYYS